MIGSRTFNELGWSPLNNIDKYHRSTHLWWSEISVFNKWTKDLQHRKLSVDLCGRWYRTKKGGTYVKWTCVFVREVMRGRPTLRGDVSRSCGFVSIVIWAPRCHQPTCGQNVLIDYWSIPCNTPLKNSLPPNRLILHNNNNNDGMSSSIDNVKNQTALLLAEPGGVSRSCGGGLLK